MLFTACSSDKADISVNALTKAAKKYGAEEKTDYKDLSALLRRKQEQKVIVLI